jgi:hypothetical protein
MGTAGIRRAQSRSVQPGGGVAMVSDREPPYGPGDVGGYQCAGADGVLVEPEEPHVPLPGGKHVRYGPEDVHAFDDELLEQMDDGPDRPRGLKNVRWSATLRRAEEVMGAPKIAPSTVRLRRCLDAASAQGDAIERTRGRRRSPQKRRRCRRGACARRRHKHPKAGPSGDFQHSPGGVQEGGVGERLPSTM